MLKNQNLALIMGITEKVAEKLGNSGGYEARLLPGTLYKGNLATLSFANLEPMAGLYIDSNQYRMPFEIEFELKTHLLQLYMASRRCCVVLISMPTVESSGERFDAVVKFLSDLISQHLLTQGTLQPDLGDRAVRLKTINGQQVIYCPM